MPRLRRSSPRRAGWTRHRWGRGFRYLDEHGDPVPPEGLERCRALRIPPAWTEVWICPWPNGHLQATGTDAAGRRQYLYHPDWRRARDRDKFQRALALGTRLPAARERVAQDLALPGMPRQRALAAGFRILDLGGLRIGTERYAREHGTVGVATIRRDHVRVRGDRVLLTFPGKSGRTHEVELRVAGRWQPRCAPSPSTSATPPRWPGRPTWIPGSSTATSRARAGCPACRRTCPTASPATPTCVRGNRSC